MFVGSGNVDRKCICLIYVLFSRKRQDSGMEIRQLLAQLQLELISPDPHPPG